MNGKLDGIFNQLKELNKQELVPGNKITLEMIKEFAEKLYEKPKEYQGVTICNKIWRDTERHSIVTCDDKKCETCSNFNEMLLKMYK